MARSGMQIGSDLCTAYSLLPHTISLLRVGTLGWDSVWNRPPVQTMVPHSQAHHYGTSEYIFVGPVLSLNCQARAATGNILPQLCFYISLGPWFPTRPITLTGVLPTDFQLR